MAKLVIPTAAAAVGFFVGGGEGAAIGWMIGSAATADKQKITLPQIQDLRIQTSAYGVMIPFVIGQQRISGNIIWAAPKTAHQTKQRSGKGGFSGGTETVVTTYTASFAVALCVGPILGIGRVWADGTLVAAPDSGSPITTQNKLPGTLYLGTDTQTPDPTIEAVEGAGNVPAYLGIAYIVMDEFDLGATGRIPNFTFEVFKEGGL